MEYMEFLPKSWLNEVIRYKFLSLLVVNAK